MTILALVDTLTECLDENKATRILSIDVHQKTNIADYMLIASGRSSRHVSAVAEKVIEKMKSLKHPPLSVHGLDTGDWVLIDFGDVIVHIMQEPTRLFYNLEALWQDAETE